MCFLGKLSKNAFLGCTGALALDSHIPAQSCPGLEHLSYSLPVPLLFLGSGPCPASMLGCFRKQSQPFLPV